MKVFFRRIHLYLGLAAGLVILICCLTGAVLVFEKDLQMFLNKNRYYVAATGSRLSPDELVKSVKATYPDATINAVKVFEAPDRTAEISAAFSPKKQASENDAAVAEKKPAAPPRQPGYTIFVNPYTGQVLEKYSYRETWFYQVFALHRWLLGAQSGVGKLIVGISTLIFL